MQEQINIQNEDGTWTIIATMDSGGAPSGEQPGLQLIEEETPSGEHSVNTGEQVS